ncbi:MAG: hypothetical protein OEW84_09410 [Aigarchaeota archaeon]|nr:hypothetical protein [Aigarchaeota archaeon]
MRCVTALSTREDELSDLEKKARKLEDDVKSLIFSFKSNTVSEQDYILKRAALEREFAKITDRMTQLKFVKGRRSRSEKT